VKLVVTIPAYNEEKSIGSVVTEIPRSIAGINSVEVLIIDDGSTDTTAKNAISAGADKVILHKGNKGLGITFKDGLDGALEMGADIIVNIDADGQYNATEISKLIQPILDNQADMVLGWRDIDNLEFMPQSKKIGNKFATWITRRFCHLPIKDAQSGFRAFSREAALRLNLSGKYTYVQESLIQAAYKGFEIEQVPIEFRPREGKSRLIPNLGSYARRAGSTIIGTYWNYHPLRVFSLISGFFGMVGLGIAIWVLIHFLQTGAVSPHMPSAILASLLIVVGVLALVLGLFADTSKNQRLLQEEILYRVKKSCSPFNIEEK